jgi:hypothetical protein
MIYEIGECEEADALKEYNARQKEEYWADFYKTQELMKKMERRLPPKNTKTFL